MKTTLELPKALMRRVKLRAVHHNQKLKDAISQLLELGMSALKSNGPPRVPKTVRLKTGRRLSQLTTSRQQSAPDASSVVLVDTIIVVYLLIECDHNSAAQALYARDSD